MPTSSTTPRTKPPALLAGDMVGIVAPASNISRDALLAGCERLRGLGYTPFYFDSIFEKDIYFAGSAERRVRELEEMFIRDDVQAIVCARGGYGSNYLLPRLDIEKIKAHPKIFVGYSDLTCLLTYFADAAGVVTFHGPMVAKDFGHPDGVEPNSWQNALSGNSEWTLEAGTEVQSLVEGSAEGILYGGCLSILVASLGTPYEIQTAGTILFLEDVATKPFQIDRMLMQLKLAGKFIGVRGIIFGEMLNCVQNPGRDQGYNLEEIVVRIVGDLGVPVAYGLRSGHVSRLNMTLPFGVSAALKVGRNGVGLKILEAATKPTPAASRATK
jgi:muramoyltetrapeptide carboxypeptidase